MTQKQQVLALKHGTPAQFTRAVIDAIGEISLDEAYAAITKYYREYKEAGQFWEPTGTEKFFPSEITAKKWREDRKFARVGLTNGCFDIIHAGHVQYLRECRSQCDYLIVLLNSNDSVRRLKGEGRPINHEHHRAYVLTGLEMVDAVVIFNDTRITKWLRRLKPDIWFKGGDYTLKTLDQSEVEAAKAVGCRITIIKQESAISTTKIYEKIRRKEPAKMDKSQRVSRPSARKLQKGSVASRKKIRGSV